MSRKLAPEYQSWRKAKARCYDPNDKRYNRYGGRGIKVEWPNYRSFLADMGPKPDPSYTLERKDYNGNYCKDNCKWLPKAAQQYNKRTSKLTHRKAENIRKAFALGAAKADLAKKYKVSGRTISSVILYKSWNYATVSAGLRDVLR